QPLIVCTIYNPQYPETELQMLAKTGLSFFNDVITEEALRRRLLIIDLREVCSEPEAFANPIEPSEVGGDLITDAIIGYLTT
ncbi:MAG: SGNH/GDSL hydrolase family protein, partial [Candidatus Tectomicrobia bacterium]